MGDVINPLEAARRKDLDPSNMEAAILSFPDQLKHALEDEIDISPQGEFTQVCICGMGGSAIGGDIIADHCFLESKIPVHVIRGIQLPRWVNKETLVLVNSYSGNTLEVLELFRQALEVGCPLIGVSSGGRLEEECRESGLPHVKVPGGLQPRCALGFTLGYLSSILALFGMPESRQEIERCIPLLKAQRDESRPENPDSPMRELAEKVGNRAPVIYSYTYMASSALRWKNQVNENAKRIAFSGTMPEFNHNEVVGWVEGARGPHCLPIFLYDPDAPPLLKDMMDASLESLRENGVSLEVLEIRGDTVMEKNLRAVMHGDLFSLFSAFLEEVDPTPVKTIVSLKEKVLSPRSAEKPRTRGRKGRRG